MLKHVVYWTLKDEAEGHTAAENATKFVEIIRNLEGRIPSLLSLDVSATFADTTTEPCHVILISTHADAEGLKAYAEHPDHMACIPFIKAIAASRKAIDFIV
ncbi:MAG: Dabb family protein [Pseudomonadota bacterium]